MANANPIEVLIHQLSRLPGVGKKSAKRLAYFILIEKNDYPNRLAEALVKAKNEVKTCSLCGNLTDKNPCVICSNHRRDRVLCVVENVPDLLAIEATSEFSGRYHILNGAISPLNGIGPDDLRIRELCDRVEVEQIREVIVATNPTIDGEATALYIQKKLNDADVLVSRLASGLPAGGDIEYLDRETIKRAIAGRRNLA